MQRLNGNDFIWAGGAYTIASTAVLPLVGGLVSGFGRKYVLIVFVTFFAVGSVICGAAQNMTMLIAGRGQSRGDHILRRDELTLHHSDPRYRQRRELVRHRDHLRRYGTAARTRQVPGYRRRVRYVALIPRL